MKTVLASMYQTATIPEDAKKQIVALLRRAYADEVFATLQYTYASKLAVGAVGDQARAEFQQHAQDEFGHSIKIFDRLIQLGETPPESIESMVKECSGVIPFVGTDVTALLSETVKSERTAIKLYNEILELSKDADPVTYDLIVDILADETEHEQDLEVVQKDNV